MFGEMTRDVGFADDADQPVVLNDRQAADLVFFHHIQHFFDAGAGVDVVGAALCQLPTVVVSGRGWRRRVR